MADDPLGALGEHPFLRRLIGRLRPHEEAVTSGPGARLLVGVGDDAAVVRPGPFDLALTTDTMVEGVHFRREWLDATELGRRSVEINLSDLAAMGARPCFTLAAVAAPGRTSASWLDALLDGCADASRAAGAALVGGNLAGADVVSVTVTAIGEIPGARLERRGARAGDDLVVTGRLGDAAAAVAAWMRGERPADEQRDRWARPSARIRAGLALARAGARAAIDVSDGLLADLGHLCEASGVGAEVERAKLPRSPYVARCDREGHDFAAAGGEDYELLAACPPSITSDLASLAKEARIEMTVIGRVTDHAGEIAFLDEEGRPVSIGGGFDHYASRARDA